MPEPDDERISYDPDDESPTDCDLQLPEVWIDGVDDAAIGGFLEVD